MNESNSKLLLNLTATAMKELTEQLETICMLNIIPTPGFQESLCSFELLVAEVNPTTGCQLHLVLSGNVTIDYKVMVTFMRANLTEPRKKKMLTVLEKFIRDNQNEFKELKSATKPLYQSW